MSDDVTDYLEEAKLDTEEAEDVLSIVEETFLDQDYDTKWKPYRVELVKNKLLESEFEGNGATLDDVSVNCIYKT